MCDFTGALAEQQETFQGGTDDQIDLTERPPDARDLTVTQDAFTALDRVASHQLAGIGADQFLTHAPGEHRRDRRQRLIGGDRRLDPRHHRFDIGAVDAGSLQLSHGRHLMNKIQNHVQGGVTDIYDRFGYEREIKHVMEDVANRLIALAEDRVDEKVVAFQRSGKD
jgi:hypothetical protein